MRSILLLDKRWGCKNSAAVRPAGTRRRRFCEEPPGIIDSVQYLGPSFAGSQTEWGHELLSKPAPAEYKCLKLKAGPPIREARLLVYGTQRLIGPTREDRIRAHEKLNAKFGAKTPILKIRR